MSQKVILTDEQIHHAIDGLIDYLEAFEQNITTLYKEWKLANYTKDEPSMQALEYKIMLQRKTAMKYLDTFYTLAAYTVTEHAPPFGSYGATSSFYCRDLTDDQFHEMQRHIEGWIGAQHPLAPFPGSPMDGSGHMAKPPEIRKILGDRYDKL